MSVITAHAADIISVAMVLLILSGKREARSTLIWLLLVVFLPYVGVFLYIFFGRSRPDYPARKLHPALSATPCCEMPETDDRLMALTEKITGIARVHADTLELLVGGREKYERLFADVAAAKERIVLSYYVFRQDATGYALLDLLARKAEEGVKVYLLYDGWGAFGLYISFRLKSYIKRGVNARPFAPVTNPLRMSRINFRNHRKIVVIDGRIGYTGSTNIGDEYLGLNQRFTPWLDLHARLTGEAATILEEVFNEDWRIATRETLPAYQTEKPGPIALHVIPTGPDLVEDRLFPLLFAHLAAAEKSIDISTPYLVPNQALVASLSVAALKGVRVRLILPKRSNHPMVEAAGRSYYEELLEGGVEIYQTPEAMLHAKALLIDSRWTMLGSANFDNRSFFLNFEVNVALAEPGFVQEIGRCFENWVEKAEKVTKEELAARPLLLKLFDAICRTLSPVL